MKTLPDEELYSLIESAQKDDSSAFKKLKEQFTPLFEGMAGWRRANKMPGNDESDFFQECYIALWEAIKSYNKNKGCSFETYLRWKLLSRITGLWNKSSLIAIPANKNAIMMQVGKVKDIVSQEKKRVATIGEVAKYLNVDKKELSTMYTIRAGIKSLNQKAYPNEKECLIDKLPSLEDDTPETLCIQKNTIDIVKSCIKQISPTPKVEDILLSLFVEQKTLYEIGLEHNLSYESIRKVGARYREPLRALLKEEHLTPLEISATK